MARASNPSFSDACALELSVGAEDLFQVSFPVQDEATAPGGPDSVPSGARSERAAGKTVTTAFQAASDNGYPSFAGVVVHSWTEREPTEDDAIIARLLVDYALAVLHQERLARSAQIAEERAAKLAIELITSRTEGEAIGVLMVTHRVTRQEAARLLRRMSRTGQRGLHEVAADVLRGADPRLPSPGHLSPVGREHIQIAASHGRTVAKTGSDC